MKMFGDSAAAALKAVKDLYDQYLTLSADFRHLKESSVEALAEYRRLHEKLVDKVETLERERARSDGEMLARIMTLEARLNAITEQAMLAAVQEQARELAAQAFVRTQASSDRLLIADNGERKED